MNRVVTRLGLTTFALVAGVVAHAQSTTTGAIAGAVTDSKGAPVAGATVTARSAQITRTATTGADGTYRIGLMNAGEWSITVTKAGMQTSNGKLTVLTGFTHASNWKLTTEATTEVVVLGTLASVDVTSVTTGMNVSTENLQGVPVARDFTGLAFLAPGVVSSGFGDGAPSIAGASGAENQYIVDGVETTDTRRGFQGAQLVTDFIEQVDVQTGGLKPEYNALSGGVFNAITKSGTNQLQGAGWATLDLIGIQAVQKSNIFFRDTAPSNRYDLGGWVSGPIIKDKLFYFAGLDANLRTDSGGLPNNIGLANSERKDRALQLLGKINYYVTQDLQLTASLNINDRKVDQDTIRPTNGNAQWGESQTDKLLSWNLMADWTISPSLFLNFKINSFTKEFSEAPTDTTNVMVTDFMWYQTGPGTQPGQNPAGVPAGTAFQRGGFSIYQPLDKIEKKEVKADLSWFLGNHNFKFGVSTMQSDYTEVQKTSGGHRDTVRRSGGGAFNGIDQVYNSTNATVSAKYTALYAQDTWDIAGSGFRAFYGFRYEIQDQLDLTGKSFMKFDKFTDVWQPRFGFTWDVNKDGKTKVTGSYARYFERIPQRMAIRVFANEVYLRNRWSAGSSTYDTTTGAYTVSGSPSTVTDFATPFSFDPIAEGTKLPQRDEVLVGVDQVFGEWTAGFHAKWRKLKNPIEDSVLTDNAGNPYDEGPAIIFSGSTPLFGVGAAILWNPGPSAQWKPNPKSMTLYILAGGGTVNNWGINILDYYNPSTGLFTVNGTNFDYARNTYVSADFTLERKTSRSYLNASYTWSRLEGNYEGLISSSNGQADNNITASFDYYPYVGYGQLPLDRTHVAKVFGSYRFDAPGGDFTVGAKWVYQSGTPISAFNDTNDLGGYGNASPVNGQLGQFGRTANSNLVDMSLAWGLKWGKVKMTPSIDIFNLFNSRPALRVVEQITTQSGSPNLSYGAERTWQTGRNYRYGIKFTF